MAATAVTGGCNTTTFSPSSIPKPPPSHKLLPFPRQLLHSYKRTTPQICPWSAPISAAMSRRSVSSPENSVVSEEEGVEQSDDVVSSSSPSLPPFTVMMNIGVVKGAEERRLKGVVMVKEGFKGGLRLCQASAGGRSKLIGLALLTCNPVEGTDEQAKAWMKSSPAGPPNEEPYHYLSAQRIRKEFRD